MASRTQTRLIFGAMTGTSIDGIDIAAVRVAGRGVRMRATLVAQAHAPLGELAQRLRAAQRQEPLTAGAFTALARDLAIAHLPPLRELARAHGDPDLVVLHGQTLFHQPPLSLQLIDTSVVAQDLGCDVVSNLRAADLAAGGQGAPITPLCDWMLFRARKGWRVIVNLGGFSNATIIPPEPSFDSPSNSPSNSPSDSPSTPPSPTPSATLRTQWIATVRGFDLCLCNQLLDHLARTRLNIPFDQDGRHAAAGRVVASGSDPVQALLDQQRRSGRSLGTVDEIVTQCANHLLALTPDDALASATNAIAQTIARAILETLSANGDARTAPRGRQLKVLVAGGGVKNAALMAALRRFIPGSVETTDASGVPADARETMAMALLGALADDGDSITLPAVTGRKLIRTRDGSFHRSLATPSHNLHAKHTIR